MYTRQSPQLLKALREMALVQSVESSNRIEGVTVAPDRLRPLVLGHARPKDRSEQEIAGYRSALNLIHAEADKLQITPDLMRRLHGLCQEGSGDAGQFKKVDNEVIELHPGAAPIVRFKCVSAKATPAAMDELCLVFRHAMESFLGDFTLADVERACPGVSRDLIRRLLWQKQKDGLLECLNRGPGAIWRKKVKII